MATKKEIQNVIDMLSKAQRKALDQLVVDGPIPDMHEIDKRRLRAFSALLDKGVIKKVNKGFGLDATMQVKKLYEQQAAA